MNKACRSSIKHQRGNAKHSRDCGEVRLGVIDQKRVLSVLILLEQTFTVWDHFAMNEEFKFRAVIQAGDGGGAFVFFPFDMLESFGTTGKVRVSGTVDGIPYCGQLFKYGFSQHILGLLKSLRTQIGKGPGDTVVITLKRVMNAQT